MFVGLWRVVRIGSNPVSEAEENEGSGPPTIIWGPPARRFPFYKLKQAGIATPHWIARR